MTSRAAVMRTPSLLPTVAAKEGDQGTIHNFKDPHYIMRLGYQVGDKITVLEMAPGTIVRFGNVKPHGGGDALALRDGDTATVVNDSISRTVECEEVRSKYLQRNDEHPPRFQNENGQVFDIYDLLPGTELKIISAPAAA